MIYSARIWLTKLLLAIAEAVAPMGVKARLSVCA